MESLSRRLMPDPGLDADDEVRDSDRESTFDNLHDEKPPIGDGKGVMSLMVMSLIPPNRGDDKADAGERESVAEMTPRPRAWKLGVR